MEMCSSSQRSSFLVFRSYAKCSLLFMDILALMKSVCSTDCFSCKKAVAPAVLDVSNLRFL